MKARKIFRKIAAVLAIALLMTSLFVPTAYAYPYLTTTPVPVYGRLLTPDKTGDSANWIEIAQNGPYSLIVRQTFISWRPNYPGWDYYNNPRYQMYNFGQEATGQWMNSPLISVSCVYARSYTRDIINNWFNDRPSLAANQKGADSLHPTARIRNYTMSNNAMQAIGTCTKESAFTDAFSAPSPVKAGFGNDVAFALSFTEAVNFVSTGADVRTNEYYRMSNPYAQMNYKRLNMPMYHENQPNGYTGMWLRSYGDMTYGVGAMISGYIGQDRKYDGRVFQSYWYCSNNWFMCTYPALWVDSAIFDTNHPITVNYYQDSVGGKLLGSDSLPPQAVGTTVNVDATKYAPAGYKVPGDVSGDTVVKAGQNTINVVYKPNTPKSTVYVYYYKDAPYNGAPLGFDTLTLDIPAGTPLAPYIDATKYAPPGYKVPGKLTGDSVAREGISLVFVAYEKGAAVQRDVYVIYMTEIVKGSKVFTYHSMDILPMDEGDFVLSSNICKYIEDYIFYDASPPSFTVGLYNTVLIRQIVNPNT